MDRRKFIIGAGSLAAGGAAAMGSGAFTTMSSGERTVDVNVAADSEAFLQIYASEGPNGAYAEEGEDGKLKLNFDGDADTYMDNGSGVNPESIYTFDDVFRINNMGTGEIDVWVEKSDLPGVYFYFGGDPDQSLQFSDWDGLSNKPASLNASAGAVEVGVKIVADELNVDSLGSLSGSVSVHAGPAGGDSEVRSQD